jgi:hypothetical protein
MAKIMGAGGARSKNGSTESTRPKLRLEQTFGITQRLWVGAEVDGTSISGWAVAGAITTGDEGETAYLLVTIDSAPVWVLSRDVTSAVLERGDE